LQKQSLLFWAIIMIMVIFLSGCSSPETGSPETDSMKEETEEINEVPVEQITDEPEKEEQPESAEDWAWKYATIPLNVIITSAASSGDTFVAVGYESTSVHSPIDALAIIFTAPDEYGPWTPLYIDSVWRLNSVTWSGEQFAAVGNDGMIYTSSDGYDWSAVNSGTTRNLYDIVWAGQQYVAVGEYGATITSPDGMNWDTKPVVIESDLNKLVHNGNFYLAVGNDGAVIKSSDGNIWEVQEIGIRNNFETLTWNGSYFMAVSGRAGYFDNEPVVVKSTDGANWEIQAFPYKKNDINGLAWHNGTYVLATDSSFTTEGIYTSQDGSAWTAVEVLEGYYTDVYWTGNNFVVAGRGVYKTSPDGVTWNAQHIAQYRVRQSIFGAAWSENKFIAVKDDGTIWTSDNMVQWEHFAPEGRNYDLYELYDVAWSGNLYVVVGNWGEIFTSEDGREWTPRISGSDMNILSVTWTGEQFVAVGSSKQYNDDMNILTSADGQSWIVRHSGTTASLNDLTSYNGNLIAVGNEGTVLISRDGVEWAPQDTPVNSMLQSIAAGPGGRLVATSHEIINSDSGVNWNLSNSPGSFYGTINSLVWDGTQFIAVGHRGIMFRSPDGIEWEQLPKVTRNDLYDLVLTGSGLIATGSNGIILWAE